MHISYPIVADGKVFVTADQHLDQVDDQTLWALDLATGEILWSKVLPSQTRWSELAYDLGRLFIVDGDGLLRAIDAGTGAELWQRPVGRTLRAPPVARGGIVYVRGGQKLSAVNAITGGLRWWRWVYVGGGVPTLSSDGIFDFSNRAEQFDAVTGVSRWLSPAPSCGALCFTAAYYSERIYAHSTVAPKYSTTTIFDGFSGNQIGTVASGTHIPAFRGGIGYYSGLADVAAVSVRSGDVLWRFAGAKKPALPPIVVNGKVVIASNTGQLFVLDEISGQTLQEISLGGKGIMMSGERTRGPMTGMGAGDGILIVPAKGMLFAFKGAEH
jgi:outer membrane protein assembly factor BamB